MTTFKPNLTILPPSQLRLWSELDETPDHFTLYGGTALALRLGHRISVDFDFFSNAPIDPDALLQDISYLKSAEVVQVRPNTLVCRVDRDGPVLVSFFGKLSFCPIAKPEYAQGRTIRIASMLDIAAAKASVIQKRAEVKDYVDIDVILQTGMTLGSIITAAGQIYGNKFNPLATLKALSYFEDVSELSHEAQNRLLNAVKSIDPSTL